MDDVDGVVRVAVARVDGVDRRAPDARRRGDVAPAERRLDVGEGRGDAGHDEHRRAAGRRDARAERVELVERGTSREPRDHRHAVADRGADMEAEAREVARPREVAVDGEQARASAHVVAVVAEERVAAGHAGIDGEEAVAVRARAEHRVAEDRDRRLDRGHVRVPGRPVAGPVGRAGEGAVAAEPRMRAGRAALQPREGFGRARRAPVHRVGVGDVDRGGHGHARVDGGELLHQLDVLEVERHAGVDVRVADLDHARRAIGAAELHEALHGALARRALAALEHVALGLGQVHGAQSAPAADVAEAPAWLDGCVARVAVLVCRPGEGREPAWILRMRASRAGARRSTARASAS